MAPDPAPDSDRDATQNNGPARMTFRPEFFKGLAVAAAVIIVDQISKWWILGFVMQPPQVIPLTPFFNLVLGWNRGISFGFLDSGGWLSAWFLPLAAVAISAVLAVWLYRVRHLRAAVGIGLLGEHGPAQHAERQHPSNQCHENPTSSHTQPPRISRAVSPSTRRNLCLDYQGSIKIGGI